MFSYARRSPWVWLAFFSAAAVCLVPWLPRDSWSGAIAGLPFLQWAPLSAAPLRLGLLETDAWTEDLRDGRLSPSTDFPPNDRWSLLWRRQPKLSLMHGSGFTPQDYLDRITTLSQGYSGICDVLLYYGGWHPQKTPRGLNFNSWSPSDLYRLRALGARPFIGLETDDPLAIRLMAQRLSAAGYTRKEPILIRLLAEPSGSAYYPTPEEYRRHFSLAAETIRLWARRCKLNLRIVFAGDCDKDLRAYAPPAETFDLIGLDLYVTPLNRVDKLALLEEVTRRWPGRRLVLAEFGLATDGEASSPGGTRVRATPAWAQDSLGEILERLGRLPLPVAQITLFSVDPLLRLPSRRWSWAWTPPMYAMLSEWQAAPQTWRREGFHRYDLLSYPVDRDILYHRTKRLKLYYRRLGDRAWDGSPLFCETLFLRQGTQWVASQRVVSLKQNHLVEWDGSND